MKKYFKELLFASSIIVPLCAWLAPPWYAQYAIAAIVLMLVKAVARR